MDSSSSMLMKGDWVHAVWLVPTNACLSGSQIKTGAEVAEVRGTVTHVRGNHPTEPTSIRVWVKPDGGGPEVVIEPSWIKTFKSLAQR